MRTAPDSDAAFRTQVKLIDLDLRQKKHASVIARANALDIQRGFNSEDSETQVAALSASQVRALASTQLAGLTATDVTEFTAEQVGSLTTTQIKGLSTTAVVALNLQMRNSAVSELSFTPSRHWLVSYNGLPHLDQAERVGWITHS